MSFIVALCRIKMLWISPMSENFPKPNHYYNEAIITLTSNSHITGGQTTLASTRLYFFFLSVFSQLPLYILSI